MIRLALGANTVCLTLKEKSLIGTPTYLFEFENNSTHDKYYCIAADTSEYKDRFNLFTITVQTTAPNALLGQLKLPIAGEFEYRVYEQSSTTNLDPTGLNMVEQGYMTYTKSMTERREFDGTTTRKAFQA